MSLLENAHLLLLNISEVEAVDTERLPIIKENLSQRYKVFLELVETEANYVGILNTIMTVSIYALSLFHIFY